MLSQENARGRNNQRALKIEIAALALRRSLRRPASGAPRRTSRDLAPPLAPTVAPAAREAKRPAPLWSRMSYDQRVVG